MRVDFFALRALEMLRYGLVIGVALSARLTTTGWLSKANVLRSQLVTPSLQGENDEGRALKMNNTVNSG
jgi:hypothetical protein